MLPKRLPGWWSWLGSLGLALLALGCAPAGANLAEPSAVATPSATVTLTAPAVTPTDSPPPILATATRPAVATTQPSPTAAPAAIPPTATATTSPTATAAPSLVYGRTEEGVYFQGYLDAPVTVIDYSDYL